MKIFKSVPSSKIAGGFENSKKTEILSIDYINFEESLKYLEIPDQLLDLKNKAKEKKPVQEKNPEPVATSSNPGLVLESITQQRPIQIKKTLDQVYNEMTKARLAFDSGSRMSLSSAELAEILGICDANNRQLIKIELQTAGGHVVILTRMLSTEQYK